MPEQPIGREVAILLLAYASCGESSKANAEVEVGSPRVRQAARKLPSVDCVTLSRISANSF
jgi:hypothetical protein